MEQVQVKCGLLALVFLLSGFFILYGDGRVSKA